MTDQNSNPFVLPGMGQGSADTAGNPLLASMEMMRQAWAGLTGPGGLAQVMPMTPPMNVQDLERRIAELRAVESWLRMNLSMLSSTIQGMEVQRSTIATLRSFVDNLSAQGQDPASWGDASPLEIVLGLKPGPGRPAATSAGQPREARPAAPTWPETHVRSGTQTPADTGAGASAGSPRAGTAAEAASPAAGPSSGENPAGAGESSAGSAQAISQAAQSASEAWWGMLQQQFNQLAAATAASMPGGTGAPAAGQPGAPAAAGTARARDTGSASSAPKAAPAKKPAAPARRPAPGKTAVRKNKIQSDPDQT